MCLIPNLAFPTFFLLTCKKCNPYNTIFAVFRTSFVTGSPLVCIFTLRVRNSGVMSYMMHVTTTQSDTGPPVVSAVFWCTDVNLNGWGPIDVGEPTFLCRPLPYGIICMFTFLRVGVHFLPNPNQMTADSTKCAVVGVAESVQTTGGNTLDLAKNTTACMVNSTKATAVNAVDAAKNAAGGLLSTAKNAVGGTLNTAKNAVGNTIGGVSKTAKNAFGNTVGRGKVCTEPW